MNLDIPNRLNTPASATLTSPANSRSEAGKLSLFTGHTVAMKSAFVIEAHMANPGC